MRRHELLIAFSFLYNREQCEVIQLREEVEERKNKKKIDAGKVNENL